MSVVVVDWEVEEEVVLGGMGMPRTKTRQRWVWSGGASLGRLAGSKGMASEPKMKGRWIWMPRRRLEEEGAGIAVWLVWIEGFVEADGEVGQVL